MRAPDGTSIVGPMAGLTVLTLALVPPVEAAAERSVAAHMAQHLALLVVAPALLATGRPVEHVASLVPRATRSLARLVDRVRRDGRLGPVVLVVAAVHAVVVSAWHVPAAYDAAVAQVPIHLLEHASLVLVGWATWVAVRAAAPDHPAPTVAGLFLVAAQGAALGAVLTFAGSPLYASGVADPMADQQLAGLLMWVPGGAPYAALAAWIVVRAVGRYASVRTLAVVRR